MLTSEEKRELLTLARESISCALHDRQPKNRYSAGLGAPSGAFVTLRLDNELRGCIGYVESDQPLAEVIVETAVKAAFEDPRFPPLTLAEFDRVVIEISVLSPLRKIKMMDEIEIGKHGILLELCGQRGLLLPQVAVEYGWDRKTFLEFTAKKAGLPPEAVQDPGICIFTFTAEVVHEADILTYRKADRP